MYINPTLFGAKITGTNEKVLYRCRPFSLSSVIFGEDGTSLISQKRASWWSLKFDMVTPNGNYKFYKRYLDYFLEHESGAIFRTHSSIDFYDSKMKRVTDLKLSKNIGKYWDLNILTEDHKSAFVLASVTICKLTPAVY